MMLPRRLSVALGLLALSACSSHGSKSSANLAASPGSPSSPAKPGAVSGDSTPPAVSGPIAIKVQNQPISTADYLRLVDELRSLGKLDSDDAVSALAGRLYAGFTASSQTALPVPFLQGPIPSAIVGEGEGPIRDAVTSLGNQLNQAQAVLDKILATPFAWPHSLPKLAVALEAADGYVTWLGNQVQASPMSSTLKAAALQQLQQQYARIRPSLAAATEGVDEAKSLLAAVTALQKAVKALGVSLSSADATQLGNAARLGAELNEVHTSQDALTVLVTVWEITPAAQRKSTIGNASSDLYSFLEGKSQDDLDCLARSGCLNPVLAIEKATIFSKLEAYGLGKIRDQVESAARAQLAAAVDAAALKALPTIPGNVRDVVAKQTAPYFDLVKKVLADVPGFTQSHVQAWAAKHFAQPLRGLETSSLLVSVANGKPARVAPAAADAGVASSGAEILGASLAVSEAFLPVNDPSALTPAILEPIQRMLALGGFRQANGKPFPGFSLPLTGSIAQVLSLDDLGSSATPFAVPDSFRANGVFQMDRAHGSRNAGTGAQAELLTGLARQIRFFRDWEQNEYDVSVGKILVQDLVPEMPDGLVDASFIPKNAPFALAVAQAGALLDNLQLGLSPLFSLAGDGTVSWAFSSSASEFGLVSIVNGARDGVARPGEIARMVLALDELLSATEGIESSTAPLLQRKTRDGRSTLLADVLEYRKQLATLKAGLAQFLAHEAVQSDGSVAAELQVRAGGRVAAFAGAPRRLEDQALVIRALLSAGLSQAALGVYDGLNRNFVPAAASAGGGSAFYVGEIGVAGRASRVATLHETVLMLLAGEELAAFMSADTHKYWDQFARAWVRGLEEL